MPVDLDDPYARIGLAQRISADIDAYAVATYFEGPRKHLGASIIGDDCSRRIYLGFRWMKTVVPSGRMLRLFNRGHREEARFVEYIKGIGGTIHEVDAATAKQFRISSLNGHFGGALDSVINLPPRYELPPNLWFLGEFKTKSTTTFDKLVKKGIRVTNFQHYDQMCSYGRKYGFKHALYFSVNKNTDDLHVEVVPLDWKNADEVERKADFIINTRVPPAKISMQATHYICNRCDYKGLCFQQHVPDKNCRSCKYSCPVEDGQWYCEGYRCVLTDDTIKAGCPQWTPIPL